ncbi:hypothetical protein JCM11641_005108 [Rhodosporidiobolus odoratus]
MTALYCLSWLACAVGFVFVLLSLASGLLYVAEVIEEHSALAKNVGKRLIAAEILLYLVLFFVDGLPWHLVAIGILAHVVYLGNFSRSWPIISLTSPIFILSCVLVLTSHFLSFRHFSHRSSASARHAKYTHYNAYNRHTSSDRGPTFVEIATYFAVAVWLVPFYLFLSLSANDNVLPSLGEAPAAPHRRASTAPQPSTSPTQTTTSFPPSHSHPHLTTSPTLSSAPSSPNPNGRHQRQRSSMMKSALSSAFSIVPSVLRPSTLSSQLPLLASVPASPSQPRNDLPRSPSPSYGFRPYETKPSMLSRTSTFGSTSVTGGPGATSPIHTQFGAGGKGGGGGAPTPTGLGFNTTGLAGSGGGSGSDYRSGGALASPGLSSSANGRMLNFSHSPQPSPSSATFPSSALPSPHGAGSGFGAAFGSGNGAPPPPPGMVRRHTNDLQGGSALGGLAGRAGVQGALKRRGTTDAGGGGGLGGNGGGGRV